MSTPATERGGAKVARAKSVNPGSKPAPVPRCARPSLGVVQSPNLTFEVKQTSKPIKRQLSVAGSSSNSASGDKTLLSSAASKPPFATASSKSVSAHKMPSSSSAATSKPPTGHSRMVVKGAATAATKFSRKK